MTPPPIFVVGCPRSGTTLLRVMLDSHPDLAIPPESHFIPPTWAVRAKYERPGGGFDAARMVHDVAAGIRFKEWDLPVKLVLQGVQSLESPSFAATVVAFFEAYASAQGKPRWGDKTPGYSLELPLLARLFPDARFVHIVRDGRNVALSFLEVPKGPRRLAEAAEIWRHRVRVGRADGRGLGPRRYLEVRYEDLVTEPERELRRVCEVAQLEFRPEMLGYTERGAAAVPPRSTAHHANLARPPTKGLRDWREAMAPSDVALFEGIAGRELSDLGYERRFPTLSAADRARAAASMAANAAVRTTWLARRQLVRLARPGTPPPHRRW